jgi:hypothetical protein
VSANDRVHRALDGPFANLGFVVADSGPTIATFVQPPLRPLQFLVSFGMERHGTRVGADLGIDPLVTPEPVIVTFDISKPERRHLRRRSWTIDEIAANAAQIVGAADDQLGLLRREYGTPVQFASRVDDEYLYDDSPELAEAVAYSWLLANEDDKAAARLEQLISDREMIEVLAARGAVDVTLIPRVQTMAATVRSDPAAARDIVTEWRDARLLRLLPDAS